jgi:hypothetical protein
MVSELRDIAKTMLATRVLALQKVGLTPPKL